MAADYPRFAPKTRKQWRAWLEKHHATSPGVWLQYARKHTDISSPSYDDTVEEALCFGWIDGLMRPVDDVYYLRLFTPRKPKSVWAASNKARVRRLEAAGLLTDAGRRAITTAKQNGSWDALAAVEALTMPADLRKAIARNASARKHWPTFTPSQQRQFLYYVTVAKRDETRARRVREVVKFAAGRITPVRAYESRRRSSRAKRDRRVS